MNYQFPKTPSKIKERIKRYERGLRKEEKKFGFISDGYGKRYLLGPLYMLLGNNEGAIKTFDWFEEKFSEDGGEPFHSLCWSLALYLSGEKTKASNKFLHTMLSNLYIIPHLLGIEQEELDIWNGSNWAMKEHVQNFPQEMLELWDEETTNWARSEYQNLEFQRTRSRYIEILAQLKNEKPGPKRNQLIDEAYGLGKPHTS